ncbi:gamma-interferon-inducible lysosomal thiol reductase-like [Macrosteles quadrilineatus]|uniref:gamma-interferon-inducible lysosomal thiol reductase-like n=1 Tax=Macrosteles quadrilineatus TaxID=74068 RepID=UPI0023E1EE27|nr:gamma-interferon-inducible lysosomal thiol reductase-like [Macrosteles quadrilineatus]
MKIQLLLLILSVGISRIDADESGDTVTVTLFYESYCPDCKDFIVNKLYSAWTSFKGHGVLFDLVAFGNARQKYVDGHWEFHCQHGPEECEANKLHACAVYQTCGDKGTKDCDVDKLSPAMDFIYCVLRKPDQLRATKQCAQDTGLDGDAILSCANGQQGDSLLNLYGNQTLAFQPRIRYVPTVAINGKHDKLAEDDLVGEICKLLPQLCHSPEVITV